MRLFLNNVGKKSIGQKRHREGMKLAKRSKEVLSGAIEASLDLRREEEGVVEHMPLPPFSPEIQKLESKPPEKLGGPFVDAKLAQRTDITSNISAVSGLRRRRSRSQEGPELHPAVRFLVEKGYMIVGIGDWKLFIGVPSKDPNLERNGCQDYPTGSSIKKL